MRSNGFLNGSLGPTANGRSPFSAIYTLKQDDSDRHATAVAEIAGSKGFAEKISELALVHALSISRINQNQVLLQAHFDGDTFTFLESLIGLEDGLRALTAHLHGAPEPDDPFAEMLAFLACGQVDVIAGYCAYPDVTVNQIRWQFGLVSREHSSISMR